MGNIKEIKKWLYPILVLFVGFVVGYYTRPQTDTIIKTEYKTDTLRITSPAEVRVDTFFQEVFVPTTITNTDTLIIVDSVIIRLPFERKVYEDSTYRAVVSGYKPILEQIDVYTKETTIYKEKTHPRLSPFVMGGLGSKGCASFGGGLFIRDKNAIGLELEVRGLTRRDMQLEVKYIHKF